MTDAATKAKELKAANAVRRVIQKVRLATPETLDALESEAFDVMSQNLEEMGSQHDKVQEELEKGMEVGRTRVEGIVEKREKEAELARRPKELMDEIKAIMEEIEPKVAALEAASGKGDGAEALKAEDAPAVKMQSDLFAKEIKEFSQACVSRATEVKQTKLPPMMHQEWTQLAQSIVQTKQKCERAVTAARISVNKALESVRKEQVEKKKKDIKTMVEAASSATPAVEQLVLGAETEVEPFIKGKLRPEAEMNELAKTMDGMVEQVHKAVEAARKDIEQPLTLEDNQDEHVKAELEAYLAGEMKRPGLRLGQLERRIARVANIVRYYRQDGRDRHNNSIMDGLKTELLEKVKGADNSAAIAAIEPLLREAEKVAQLTLKNSKMTVPQMKTLAEKVTRVLEVTKAAFTSANQAVCPIDPSLDEDVQKKLRFLVAPQIKKPLQQLGQLDRRLNRLKNLLKMFLGDISQKHGSSYKEARLKLVKVARKEMAAKELDLDKLFESASKGATELDDIAFVMFANSLDKKVKKDASEEEETLEITSEEVSAVFSAFVPEGKQTMDSEAFGRCLCLRLTVVKPTTLTSELSIAESKTLRALKVGEILEQLEGPEKEGRTAVKRVRVKALKDGKIGWASIAGNAGSIFLKASDV